MAPLSPINWLDLLFVASKSELASLLALANVEPRTEDVQHQVDVIRAQLEERALQHLARSWNGNTRNS